MKNILCFAAHPDDLEFSCIGTLKKMSDHGFHLIYVIITNGENGFKLANKNKVERVKIRKQEQITAAKELKVKKVLFLDYRDGFLKYTEKLRKQLVLLIQKYKPEIVFSFDPANNSFDSLNLYHRDHRITAEVVFDAMFAAKNKYIYSESAHRVKEIYFYASQKPNHIEDITELIEFKLKVLKCFKSQFSDYNRVADYVKNEISKRSDKYEYSEVFRKLKVRQIL
jgi:LmbE family N-acetylglucosaminyl deacetylase